MKFLIPSLLLFIFGCSAFVKQETPVPGWDNLRENYEEMDKYDLSLTTSIIYLEWDKTFGDPDRKFYSNLSNLMIEWTSDELPVQPPYRLTKSVTIDPQHIRIRVDMKDQFYALYAHELVHIALWSINKDPDDDHEGPKYPGWTKEHNEWIEEMKVKAQQ